MKSISLICHKQSATIVRLVSIFYAFFHVYAWSSALTALTCTRDFITRLSARHTIGVPYMRWLEQSSEAPVASGVGIAGGRGHGAAGVSGRQGSGCGRGQGAAGELLGRPGLSEEAMGPSATPAIP